jgi:PPOX class probable F420-dependent enzyme
MAREMTTEEWRAFVLEGTRTAKVATTRSDGAPHVTPVWVVLDGTDVVFTTDATSVKAKTIRRDPRVSLCVDDQEPLYSFVMIDGTATLDDDLDELSKWARAVGARYMGADRADEFAARNAVPGELVVRVTPTRVVARADVSA